MWAWALIDYCGKLKPDGAAVVWTEKNGSYDKVKKIVQQPNSVVMALLYEWAWDGIFFIHMCFGLVGIFITKYVP